VAPRWTTLGANTKQFSATRLLATPWQAVCDDCASVVIDFKFRQ
jgi:hypothetical protein